jgi:hypothetical protein
MEEREEYHIPFVPIILLGASCHVTYLKRKWLKTQQLNHLISMSEDDGVKTGVFEWLLSLRFKDILHLIDLMSQNKISEVKIHKSDTDPTMPDDLIGDTQIRTAHYLQVDFSTIFQRRAKRFIEEIQSHTHVIMIRDDHSQNEEDRVHLEDVIQLQTLIHKINPHITIDLIIFQNHELVKIENEKYNNNNNYNKCQIYIYENDQNEIPYELFEKALYNTHFY